MPFTPVGPGSEPGPTEDGIPDAYEFFNPNVFNPELKEELKFGLVLRFSEFGWVDILPFPKADQIKSDK